MHVWVELVARLARDLLETAAGEQPGELLLHQLHALGDLGLLVVLGGVERPLEVVEHGQELADQRLGRPGRMPLRFARHPLSEVVEVGGEAAQVVQVLLGAAAGVGQLGLELAGLEVGALGLGLYAASRVGSLSRTVRCNLGIRPRLVLLVGHERSLASSTTSASTISSSPDSAAPSVPFGAPVAAACWACW